MIKSPDIPSTTHQEEVEQWKILLDILRYLRSEHGCPWDIKQTIASLRPHIIEEPTELLEAIGNWLDNPSTETHTHLREEMGDVFLVITMMMIIYDSNHNNTFSTIIETLNAKLIRRHPHVFEGMSVESSQQLSKQWHQIKTEQEGKTPVDFPQYKSYMHVLERTKEIQKKMSKEHGLLTEPLTEKTKNLVHTIKEIANLEDEKTLPKDNYSPTPDIVEKIIGDALFSLIDIARTLKVSPTSALTRKITFEIRNITSQ